MYAFKDVAIHNQIKYGNKSKDLAFIADLYEIIKNATRPVNAAITKSPNKTH